MAKGYWSTLWVCVLTFYVLVAHHFGVGILDLPIVVGPSGLGPFVIVYLWIVAMEILVVILGLQAFHNTRQRVIERKLLEKGDSEYDFVDEDDSARDPLIDTQDGNTTSFSSDNTDEDDNDDSPNDPFQEEIEITERDGEAETDETLDDEEEEEEEEEGGEEREIIISEEILIDRNEEGKETKRQINEKVAKIFNGLTQKKMPYVEVSMPLLTQEHFNRYVSYIMDMCIVLALIPISKTIATVQTFLLLFTTDEDLLAILTKVLVPLFLAVSSFVLLAFADIMTLIVSIVTNCNIVFIISICILGVVVFFQMKSVDMVPDNVNNWSMIFEPIFMTNVAISENCYIIPFMFARLYPLKRNTRWFIGTTIFAIVVSATICFVWVCIVLSIVPQTEDIGYEGAPNLMDAKHQGELATVPFAQIVLDLYPSIAWITTVMTFFIFLTISITYVVDFLASRHIFYAYYETYRGTRQGRRCAEHTGCPRFLFGLGFFLVYVTIAAIVCFIFIEAIDFLLELLDSVSGIVADLVVVLIILSDSFLKPPVAVNGMGINFFSRNTTRILAIIYFLWIMALLIFNIIHLITRIATKNIV